MLACHYGVQRRDLRFGVARGRVACVENAQPPPCLVSATSQLSSCGRSAESTVEWSGAKSAAESAKPLSRAGRTTAAESPLRGGRKLPNLSLIVRNRKRRRWYG
jgi:hypothetical protein